MPVLRSLRIGGAFAYAPVLPFVEALLPASEYRRDRITLPSELIIPSLLAAREATRIDWATRRSSGGRRKELPFG